MAGGAKFPEFADMDDNKIIDIVFNELKQIIGLKEDPEMVRVYRWDKAIPQYILGHVKKLDAIDERLKNHPGLFLAGNAYRGIGINDCVENGYKVADEIMKIVESG
jgi:oxygen-dependent protoporphyrinogen oxidase